MTRNDFEKKYENVMVAFARKVVDEMDFNDLVSECESGIKDALEEVKDSKIEEVCDNLRRGWYDDARSAIDEVEEVEEDCDNFDNVMEVIEDYSFFNNSDCDSNAWDYISDLEGEMHRHIRKIGDAIFPQGSVEELKTVINNFIDNGAIDDAIKTLQSHQAATSFVNAFICMEIVDKFSLLNDIVNNGLYAEDED